MNNFSYSAETCSPEEKAFIRERQWSPLISSIVSPGDLVFVLFDDGIYLERLQCFEVDMFHLDVRAPLLIISVLESSELTDWQSRLTVLLPDGKIHSFTIFPTTKFAHV